jgi:hypothetical protein
MRGELLRQLGEAQALAESRAAAMKEMQDKIQHLSARVGGADGRLSQACFFIILLLAGCALVRWLTGLPAIALALSECLPAHTSSWRDLPVHRVVAAQMLAGHGAAACGMSGPARFLSRALALCKTAR